MYYVIIKKPQTHPPEFMGFKVPKFITKKHSDNVIFEFKIDGKVVRKWINKSDILLVTQDRAFYLKIMNKFKKVQEEQQLLVEEAQQKLHETIDNFAETMNKEFESFEAMREEDGIPCILKDLD